MPEVLQNYAAVRDQLTRCPVRDVHLPEVVRLYDVAPARADRRQCAVDVQRVVSLAGAPCDGRVEDDLHQKLVGQHRQVHRAESLFRFRHRPKFNKLSPKPFDRDTNTNGFETRLIGSNDYEFNSLNS